MIENLVLLMIILSAPLLVAAIVVTYQTVRESIQEDYADERKMKRDRYYDGS